ncbi:hypothetical protein MTR67_019011 [Solanum verrucosum]|uniref:Uncharacterized protein n=1 Tax=Solanum verrucosum TaxID=315347 RepID=A0AAF0TMX0_SOLVR|nr:hypothetical protein MTR67_019011 [Solanum verrucosum]
MLSCMGFWKEVGSLVVEGLNYMIKVARNNECLRGFEVVTNQTPSLNASMEVTHLQYVDDTLIFCDAEGLKKGNY